MLTPVSISSREPHAWKDFTDRTDCVPDAMIIRAAELFLNGRHACRLQRLDEDAVWEALDRNVDGILTFFDLLLTRDAVPLVNYHDTFQPDTYTPAARSLLDIVDAASPGRAFAV